MGLRDHHQAPELVRMENVRCFEYGQGLNAAQTAEGSLASNGTAVIHVHGRASGRLRLQRLDACL